MIRKLRKKLMIVLMCVMCTFLVCILAGITAGTMNSFESRGRMALNTSAQEWSRWDQDGKHSSSRSGWLPTAVVSIRPDGTAHIEHNGLYYLTDEELSQVVAELEQREDSSGSATEYQLRYMRRKHGQRVVYSFSDTTIQRSWFRAQLLFSLVIGLCAAALFGVVSFFLAKWMVKPVERVWEKQRQFIADASHELKTPLTVVLSNAEMLIAAEAVQGEKNRKRLDNICAESQRMKGLVEGLLTLARADGQNPPPMKETINVSYLVTSATLAMESAVYDSGHSLEMSVEEHLHVRGIESQLHQVVEILMDNACKYSTPATPIRLSLSRQGKEAVLCVRSEGKPLTPEECTNVFERFYRLDQSRGEEKGYGLGLSIAFTIVQRHHGKIEARSDGIKTNEFLVSLPWVQAEG